jgi:hypothetical protein
MRRMPEPPKTRSDTHSEPPASAAPAVCNDADKTLCERCGAEMYRMHAVWRCPACGFKTDCCGW